MSVFVLFWSIVSLHGLELAIGNVDCVASSFGWLHVAALGIAPAFSLREAEPVVCPCCCFLDMTAAKLDGDSCCWCAFVRGRSDGFRQ